MVVSLSSLNRAALAAREMYWWINGAAVVLSLVIAKMSVSAYAAIGQTDKALLCVTCQILGIVAAVLARRALTAQMPWIGALVGAGALGSAWWASHGLALAWTAGGDPANEWMVFFLTAFEPLLFLCAEHIKEGREALRAAQLKADADTAAELAAIRERADRSTERPRLATLDGIALGASGVALTVSGASAQVSDIALPAAHLGAIASERAPIESSVNYPSARHHVLALMSGGVTKRAELHRITGVKPSTVSNWARQIEAGTFKVSKEA